MSLVRLYPNAKGWDLHATASHGAPGAGLGIITEMAAVASSASRAQVAMAFAFPSNVNGSFTGHREHTAILSAVSISGHEARITCMSTNHGETGTSESLIQVDGDTALALSTDDLGTGFHFIELGVSDTAITLLRVDGVDYSPGSVVPGLIYGEIYSRAECSATAYHQNLAGATVTTDVILDFYSGFTTVVYDANGLGSIYRTYSYTNNGTVSSFDTVTHWPDYYDVPNSGGETPEPVLHVAPRLPSVTVDSFEPAVVDSVVQDVYSWWSQIRTIVIEHILG